MPELTRRGFLGALVSLVIVPRVGPVPSGLPSLSSVIGLPGTYGGIDRATFSFWRNQSIPGTSSANGAAFTALHRAMCDVYFDGVGTLDA